MCPKNISNTTQDKHSVCDNKSRSEKGGYRKVKKENTVKLNERLINLFCLLAILPSFFKFIYRST